MPEVHTLLKSQRNRVFEILQAEDLEPANFSWKNINLEDKIVPRLNYLDGRYYFQFDLVNGLHYCQLSPGEELIVQFGHPKNWYNQTRYLRIWVKCLKKEIEAPDLWQKMGKYRASVSLALPEQLLNEPISASEAEEIAKKVSLLADKIEKQFQLTNEQNQFVRSKLNFLTEAAKQQKSIVWVHTSIGVFITIAMGLALAPDRAKELWQLFESIFGGIIHLIGS